MLKRGSLQIEKLLDRARRRLYDASGWQGRPGNPEDHQRRCRRAQEEVDRLEEELRNLPPGA